MKKLLIIGLKDIRLAFRDRAALIMMLLAPFLLTIGLGFVSGRFSNTASSGISNIPVILINQDGKELGDTLVEVFQSQDLGDLMEPTIGTDIAAARQLLLDDKAAAVVIIPEGFTASIIPETGQTTPSEVVDIQIINNPAAPTSASIVQTIVEGFIGQVELARISSEVSVSQLLANGLIQPDPQAIAAAAQTAVAIAGEIGGATGSIKLKSSTASGEDVQFDILAYMAPGMALMFLMFTVSYGGRSILLERTRGTLPRLLISPTSTAAVLGGKVLGTYLTGVAQILILIAASTVLFQVKWGNPVGILLLILASAFGATGWGMLLTSFSRTPGQVANIGSALMLTFGILGGSFINLEFFPPWLRLVSKITPNAWGLEGFTTLALGGGIADLQAPLLGLLVMGVVLFAISLLLFNRQAIAQK